MASPSSSSSSSCTSSSWRAPGSSNTMTPSADARHGRRGKGWVRWVKVVTSWHSVCVFNRTKLSSCQLPAAVSVPWSTPRINEKWGAQQEAVFLEGMYSFWGFKIGIRLHTHQDLNLKCCRVMGQKLRYGRPCTHDLPGTHNWLAVPHCFQFLRIPLTILCWQNSGSLEWIAASLAWLIPRPAPERVCLWLLDMSTNPSSLPNLLKKGANRLGLGWEFLWYLWNFVEVSQKFSGGGAQKIRFPKISDFAPASLPDWIHTYTNRKLTTSGFQIYRFWIWACRPKVTQPAGSWARWLKLTIRWTLCPILNFWVQNCRSKCRKEPWWPWNVLFFVHWLIVTYYIYSMQ